MTDNIYAPLTASCVRTLTDKLYEKRKAAALEIEKLTRDLVQQNQLTQVERLLEVLSDLARSHNPHTRKGGLIGLAASAIALGRLTPSYTSLLINPVLECFADTDSRVRYYACEALYNIVKVARESVMPHFGNLFDTLSRLSADPDQNVRNGAELLDGLLKNIVASSDSFHVSEFMSLLKERIYTKNTNTRQFLVSWVQALHNIPDINLLLYLPEVLDGFFQILSDQTPKIREECEKVLGEFLRSIIQHPQQADLPRMVNVVIVHAQSGDDMLQYIALVWLREFMRLDGLAMLGFVSGYLTSVLPCLAVQDELRRSGICEVAKSVNAHLLKLVTEDTPEIVKHLDLVSVVSVLRDMLSHDAVPTRVAVLRWIHQLYKTIPVQVFPHVEELFPMLIKLLSDAADEVVLLDLEVLSDLCMGENGTRLSMDALELHPETFQALKGTSPYFVQFLLSLLEMFRRDAVLLVDRGPFIIRQACVLLRAEEVFRALAILITYEENDLEFASSVVQSLNAILFTSPELFNLRNTLKDLQNECCRLFEGLYRCFCYHPVCLMSLCLLTQSYAHAAQLILFFSKLEITADFLSEIDKLIQLLESPVFTYLRLQLLDPDVQHDLATVLYGLLMLLPQTEAFNTLHRRLQCLPMAVPGGREKKESKNQKKFKIAFDDLLAHFHKTQEKHQQYRRMKRRQAFDDVGVNEISLLS